MGSPSLLVTGRKMAGGTGMSAAITWAADLKPKLPDPRTVSMRRDRPATATHFTCDSCGRRADSVHVVPTLTARDRRIELACPRHDPGGYWFYLRRWLTGPNDWRNPGEPYTMREHILDTKRLARRTVRMIDKRLAP
jgi:hypothetical protein